MSRADGKLSELVTSFVYEEGLDANAKSSVRALTDSISLDEIPVLDQSQIESAITDTATFAGNIGLQPANSTLTAYADAADATTRRALDGAVGTQAEIQAAITDAKSFRDRIGTALTKVTGNNLLPEFLGAIANLRETGVGRATLLNAGDSTGGDILAYLYHNLWSAYGFGGYTGKPISNVIENNMTGGATLSVDNADYTKWPSSKHYTLPSGGAITWTRASGYALNLRFVASILKVYYITDSGAGTFKVQYQNAAGAWTDIAGYTAVSAVGVDGLGVLTIPAPDGVREYVWRVLGVSGTVTICDIGVLNTAGFNYVAWNCGGTDIANAMGTKAGVARTPANIVTAALADIVPDLLIHATKDDIGPLTAALPVWQAFLNAANPLMDCIFCGNYCGTSGDAGQLAMNAVMKAHAVSAGKTYYDYFLSSTDMTNYNFLLDATHANPRFQRWLGLQFCEDFGLLRGPNGQIPFPVNNASVRTQTVEASIAVRSGLAQINRLEVGGYGAAATSALTGSGVSSITLTNGGVGYASPVLSFSGGAGSGAAATATAVNGVITSITVINAGTGYNSPPTVTITDAAAPTIRYSTPFTANTATFSGVNNQTIDVWFGVGLRIVGRGTNNANIELVPSATNGVPIRIFATDGTTLRAQIVSDSIALNVGLTGDSNITAGGSLLFRPGGVEAFRAATVGLEFPNGKNIKGGTGTGTKIGTATTEKFGFWNATPVVQQVLPTTATTAEIVAMLQTLGLCRQS